MSIVVKKPLLTERSMKLAKDGYFTFLVDKDARKPDVVKCVKVLFGVDPVSIKVANYKGGVKLQRNRKGYTKTAGYKKAMVQLKKGQKIDIFQPVDEKVEVRTAEGEVITKEKKSMLKGTKVKIEKGAK